MTESSKGLRHYLREHCSESLVEPTEHNKFLSNGEAWLKKVRSYMEQAPQFPPTCLYKGVTVVLNGEWQDNQEAREFRTLLNKLIKETTP